MQNQRPFFERSEGSDLRLDPGVLSEGESIESFSKVLTVDRIKISDSIEKYERRETYTMSFRSGSPWTRRSSPIFSWKATTP